MDQLRRFGVDFTERSIDVVDMLESYFPDSSAILTVAYDEDAQELTIGLSTGRTYVYRGVESWVYDGLLSAKSAGRFYNQLIKDRYPYVGVLVAERSPGGARRLGVLPASRRRLGAARRSNARVPLARTGRSD